MVPPIRFLACPLFPSRQRRVGALFALLLLVAASLAGAAERKKPTPVPADFPEPFVSWLKSVEILISEEEREAFLALAQDYQREAFIEKFWQVRDPYPDTARNELKERWAERVAIAENAFGALNEERSRVFLINGPPAERVEVRCATLLWPVEIWVYNGSERMRSTFFLVFYRQWGGGNFRIWQPFDGLDRLFQDGVGTNRTDANVRIQQIRNTCFKGDEIASMIGYILNLDSFDYQEIVTLATTRPDPPRSEWVSTFQSYSTDLAPDAALLPARFEVFYPGRRQSRTVAQMLLTVAREDAALGDLAGHRSYNFVLTGEILSEGKLFDSFRYRYEFPGEGAAQERLPLAFLRHLRPGEYRLVAKLEDLNSGRLFRTEQALSVPAVGEVTPPPPSPEMAALLAEATAATAAAEVTVKLRVSVAQVISGLQRIDALTTGGGIDRVSFLLDGKTILTKKQPPFNVELDLGRLPRPRILEAIAYDTAGTVLATDQTTLNASPHRFSVRLTEPLRGQAYKGSLKAATDVLVPEGSTLERVELFLNETRVATLYQPPWEQPIVLPDASAVAYVQAVAYLADGASTQDLVFVNAPEIGEEFKIQFVELYTTVVDRGGRPVTDLAEADFKITEDKQPQQILRFEKVEDLSLHAAVMLDVSASIAESLASVRAAAVTFLEQILRPKDRAAVITFNDRPELAVKFTNDLKQLGAGLAGLKAERGTALYDSVVFALHYFNGVKGQRALLVLSDGKDESSKFTFEDAREYARRAGVTLYAIGLDLPKGDARRKLEALATETGGRSFFVDSPAELPAIYAQIDKELRAQFLLAYQSTNTSPTGEFRTIEVDLARSGLEAKTMRGYYP